MRRTIPSVWILAALLGLAPLLQAQVEPEKGELVASRTFRHPDLELPAFHDEVRQLPAAAADQARLRLARLGVREEAARVDRRSGRFVTLLPAVPLVAGSGVGNRLSGSDFQTGETAGRKARETVAAAFGAFLSHHKEDLLIRPEELGSPRVTSHGDTIYQIYVPRILDGVPVRDSYITAVVNHGNLILMSTHQWGDRPMVSQRPEITLDEAVLEAEGYLSPLVVTGPWDKAEKLYVPMASANGNAYRYALVWAVKLNVAGDDGRFEVLVDAHSGEILADQDTNRYANVQGGVLPVTNDGVFPDGVEQAGWPLPYQDTTLGTTTTGGYVPGGGSITATFYGPYVQIDDNCGAESLTQNDDVDWGSSGGTDCTTPGFGGAGNTHASRTGFYELNKLKEMARGQLPSNTWLQGRLTANMNINSTCNAFWNGSTVNFYRSGGGCSNTGEIAGVFDHEWGHGMDDNDATPGIASPSGEGIADVYAALRLNDSCIGRGFRPGIPCSGYGDPCLDCTGVRDIDYLQRQSGQPHDYTWRNATCGGGVHCSGYVYSEAVWSLWKRKLRQAPYNYDDNTAHEIVNRLTFLGAGATGTWFSGGPPNGGCAGGSGYLNYLAADDDNGDLNDGTPHMTAIYEAFNDQEIACATPAVQDSGCAGAPASAPAVTATPSDKSVDLSWGLVSGATSYQVYRTEGVFACDFGKVLLGETAGTTWSDTGLQNGRQYSYVVIPKGGSASCFGPASSCANATPASGPNLGIDTGSVSLVISGGDSDAYLDNCEYATLSFDVSNTGIGVLTNVRIVSVTPSNPGVAVTTGFPSAVSPSTLIVGATGTGSFSLTAGGLSFGETLTFQVEVTADELGASKLADLDVTSAETDLQFVSSQSYSFETDPEGWTTVQGTFVRENGGGALGTTWFEQSSANLDNQCDQVRSPVLVLSPTSTLTLYNNYDIEPQYTNGIWYDRANVGIYEVATGSRTAVHPDGGRLYNASGPQGTCGTAGQEGWADTALSWDASTWTAGALGAAGVAGAPIRLDIRYGTDANLSGLGFRFDEVTITDVSFLVPDARPDSCSCAVDADCDDALSCNGVETCDAGSCQAGTPPDCDDGVVCTLDSCNEGTHSCDNLPSDAVCDNGLFCDGAETCDAALGCQEGFAPCPGGICDETQNVCFPSQATLTVNRLGSGTGQVTSDPPGISCGSDCSETFGGGTVVTLIPTANAGSAFEGWSGPADCSDGVVTMDADKSCTATFRGPPSCADPVEVALQDSTAIPSYFLGINTNIWGAYQSVLESDPLGRFSTSILTSLDSASLAGKEVLVLPDNAVSDGDLAEVDAWFGPGKLILAIDSAVCYAAYSGYLWPGAAGTSGNGTYWSYASSTGNQEVLRDHFVTRGYTVGQVLSSQSGDARAFTSQLPSDAVDLTGPVGDSAGRYVVLRDVPGRGRILLLGPYAPITGSDLHDLIRDAAYSLRALHCPAEIFDDGFESGDTSRWSLTRGGI